jgi:hypothetical protein
VGVLGGNTTKVFFGTLVAGVFSTLQLVPPAAAEPLAELDTFLTQFRCRLVERLEYIHAHDNRAGPDRFLAVASFLEPQSYIQCLFIEGDSKLLCEASSGFYANRLEDPWRYRLNDGAVASLKGLGFSLDKPEGNFQQMIEIQGEPDYQSIADFMLKVLFNVYRVGIDASLKLTAPLVPASFNATSRCDNDSDEPLPKSSKVAFSLVSGNDRIDVAFSDLTDIRVHRTDVHRVTKAYDVASVDSGVQICYSESVKSEICKLTQRLIRSRLGLWKNCRLISNPMVNESLCSNVCTDLSIYDYEDAVKVARELRSESNSECKQEMAK